jgi:hypothetical protein
VEQAVDNFSQSKHIEKKEKRKYPSKELGGRIANAKESAEEENNCGVL